MSLNPFFAVSKRCKNFFVLTFLLCCTCFSVNSQISPILTVPQGHKGQVRSCFFTPNDNYIISTDDDHVLSIWDGSDGRQIFTLRDSSASFKKIEVNNQSTFITALTDSGRLYSIDFRLLKDKVIADSVPDFSMNPVTNTIYFYKNSGSIYSYSQNNNTLSKIKTISPLLPVKIIALLSNEICIQDESNKVYLVTTVTGKTQQLIVTNNTRLKLQDYHPLSGRILCSSFDEYNDRAVFYNIDSRSHSVKEKIILTNQSVNPECVYTNSETKIIVTRLSDDPDGFIISGSPAIYSFKTGKKVRQIESDYVFSATDLFMNFSKRNIITKNHINGSHLAVTIKYDFISDTSYYIFQEEGIDENRQIACGNKSNKIAVFEKTALLPAIYQEGRIIKNNAVTIKKYADLKIRFNKQAPNKTENKSEKRFSFLLAEETLLNDSTFLATSDSVDKESGYYSHSICKVFRQQDGTITDSIEFPYHEMAQVFMNSKNIFWGYLNKFYVLDIASLQIIDSIIYQPDLLVRNLRLKGSSIVINKSSGYKSDVYDFVKKVMLDTTYIEESSLLKPIDEINYSHRTEGFFPDITGKDYDYLNNTTWEYPFFYNRVDTVAIFDTTGEISSYQAVQQVPYLRITKTKDTTQLYPRDIAEKIRELPVQQVRSWKNDSYIILTRSNKLFLYSYPYDSVTRELSLVTNEHSRLFIHSDKIFVSNENRNDTYIIDIENNSILSHLKGFFNPLISQTAGLVVLQDAAFGNFYIYNADNYQFVSTITAFSKTDYIVNTSSGLFDGTDKAIENLYFLYNDTADNKKPWKTIDLTQLKAKYFIPGLWNKLISGDSTDLPDVESIKNISLSPDIITDSSFSFKKPYNITLTDRGGGIGTVRILINGKEVIADARNKGLGNAKKISLAIDLNPYRKYFDKGNNSIQVFCSNIDSSLTSRGIILSAPDENTKQANPKLFVISIGTSDYKGGEIDLQYSSKDANDIATALQTGAKNLFTADSTITYVLSSNSSDSSLLPSKQNIENVFREISIKAEAKDIVVLYLSGHGINASGDFYYLTKDAYTANPSAYIFKEVLQAVAISSNEFTEYLKKIAALKQLFIIDACASGKLVENLIAHRDIPFSTLKALDRLKDRTGTHILTGCAADAVSYEASRFGQGLLTYSLLEGMKGASLRENKFLDVVQWFQYARERVPQLAAGLGGIQTPQMYSPSGNQSFDIAELNEDEKKLVPLAAEKPVIIRSAFQEEENFTDVLAVGRQLDNLLYETSSQNTRSNFLFFPVAEFPNAYQVLGRYKVVANEIKAVIKVVKPEKPEQAITFSFTAVDVNSLTQLIAGKLADLK